MKISTAYISNINSSYEKQVILLMTPNEDKEGWHYLPTKKLYALLKRIPLKHSGDFYCLNCLQSFRTKIKNLNLMKKYLKIKTFADLQCHPKRIIY